RFVYSGAAGGGFRMDGSDNGQTWGLQEGGFLYGSSFGTYANMVNWCTGSFAPISDRNYKQDLGQSTANATDVIKQFDFRKFMWTKGKHTGETVEIGLIAQDLEKINPNLADDVYTFKKDENDPTKDVPDTDSAIKVLNTAALLTLALKSIKELEERITKLGG
ncbi:MAG: tail fiber domain-containing protein, partial [Bacteroidales bacterium]